MGRARVYYDEGFHRIFVEAEIGLRKLRNTLRRANLLQFSTIEKCKKECDHLRAKFEMAIFHLDMLGEEERLVKRTTYQPIIDIIQSRIAEVEKVADEKGWFREKVAQVKFLSDLFGIVRRVLRFFGLAPKLLPPPDKDSDGI